MDNFVAVGIAEGFIDAEDEDQVIEAWQHLHDTGLAYRLQGSFGREAQRLLAEGVIHDTPEPTPRRLYMDTNGGRVEDEDTWLAEGRDLDELAYLGDDADEIRENNDNLARELGPARARPFWPVAPPGYHIWEDTYTPGDWYYDDPNGKRSPTAYSCSAAAVLAAQEHDYTSHLPPGYKILTDGIIDPYYAIKDDDFGTIVGRTHAFRGDAVADAWRHWHNTPPNALDPSTKG